jgi:hypothetical protein
MIIRYLFYVLKNYNFSSDFLRVYDPYVEVYSYGVLIKLIFRTRESRLIADKYLKKFDISSIFL